MIFDSDFRDQLLVNLRKQNSSLIKNCHSLAKECINSYYRLILGPVSFPPDVEKAEWHIRKTFEQGDHPQLKLRLCDDQTFWQNEIFFYISQDESPVFNSPEERVQRMEGRKFEYICEEEFWKDKQNEIEYSKYPGFTCFNDVIISEADVNRYRHRHYSFNAPAWLDYVFNLTKNSFPDFTFNDQFSSSKIYRFLKPIGPDLYFGFEYDASYLGKLMKVGRIGLPDYFNLVVFNSQFKRSTPLKNYVYAYNDNILSLGILGTPFFFEPCVSLIAFAGLEMFTNFEDLDYFAPKYYTTLHPNSDGTFSVKHSEIYGDKLKRHAFFYMKALAYSTPPYLKYVEKALIDTCKNVKN
jgi:hypothetical protein